MPFFYSFNYLNKELGCACDLRDFLPNEKHLLTHYDKLPTEVYRFFFVQVICHMSIFRTKRELLLSLKERFENAEISEAEFKKFKKDIKKRW